MTETALDPTAIDRLIVTGYEQRPLAVVAMLVTLYVPRGDDPVARQAIAALVDGYVAVAGAHLRWALSGDARLRDLRKQPLASCVERTRGLAADQSFEIPLSGADDFDDASPFGLSCLMARRQPPPNMGYLSASFPLGFLDRQPPGWFFQWVAAACAQLQPIHGYAGLGLIRSMDGGTAQLAEPAIYPLAERFPGLEIDDPIAHTLYLEDGIKGVNWLTIVSDPLLARIGRRAGVRSQFSDRITVHDTVGGLIIQAGPVPQLGDRETGFIPERYREVYRVLRPLQADYPDILIDTPDPIDPMAFKERWMTRFA